jgi:SAM-dependent methyltransferase
MIGSDFNSEMIAMARSLSSGEGSNISWQQESALNLPFADNEFDAVISQQGIQFFPGSAAGLREMARVTKPGGRLAATVWAAQEQSPYLLSVFGMLTQHCGADPSANAKAYADGGADQVRGWFKSADLGSTSIELVEATVSMPPLMEYVSDHIKALPPLSVAITSSSIPMLRTHCCNRWKTNSVSIRKAAVWKCRFAPLSPRPPFEV